MLRILLADDNKLVRRSLSDYLRQELPEVVIGEAASGAEALRLAEAEAWDVVILDIYMPGQNGLDALKALRQTCPTLPVIMLSMYASYQYVSESLKAGAAGYVLKELSPTELVMAVKTVMAGQIYLGQNVRDFWPPSTN